ncbi:cilia- and flagella-associated protein 61-like [Anticarsia gemmatalis]|uniref:cilia- and flagella-associated protein 61-like n=1 Tax=Anticarsia gemmatalis TaxID=129554 RepID=UPI003F76A70E
MSIYFDYKPNKSGNRFRRAVESDRHDIELIYNRERTETLFDEVNVGAMIELSVLSICMINEQNRVLGFMVLEDHPNISGVDPAHWECWIRNQYQRFYLSRNTLFIHFMCCADSVASVFFEEALISVFYNDACLLHIVLVVPVGCSEKVLLRHGAFKKYNFCKVVSKRTEDKLVTHLLTALRQEFCPKLRMRRAVEEDNDDVVEILDKSSPRLKDLYGKYYISEIIGRHPEMERKILVADVQGRAVAVMGLNTEINYKKLQSTYELKPFNGLVAPTPLEKEQSKRSNQLLKTFGEPILKGKEDPFDFVKETQSHHMFANMQSEAETNDPSPSCKVNFRDNARMRHSLDHIIVKHHDSDDLSDKLYFYPSSPHMSQTTLLSIINMLDEDPFDYEIVNIDKSWLTDTASIEEANMLRTTVSVEYLFSNTKRQLREKNVKRNKKTSRNVKIAERASTTHHGIKNAFMIELFALRDDIDERHSYDMLEAAFEIMKEFDYCIIRVPTSEKSFHLLQHFCYVPTKARVCSEYALYIAHRSSIFGKLRVREAEMIDIPEIATLLHPLDGADILLAVKNIIYDNRENQAYVFTSGMSVVGVGILELPEEIEYLRGRYNIDAFQIHKYRYQTNGVEAGYANIKAIIAYPTFEPHYRFFARELMRLSGSNTLMWVTAYRNKWTIHKGNAIVAAMVPLTPRRCEIDGDSIHELRRLATMNQAIVPFSSWLIGKRITSIPKMNITTRIVIVGSSRTALGFLNALLFDQPSTYLTFTNVTIISTNGLPYMRRSDSVAEDMFLHFHTNKDNYLKSIPYSYYVNVIQGKMAEIDLHEKFVTLTSGNRFYYDLLFLFFGKQYQHPNHMKHLLEREIEYQNRTEPKYVPLDVPRYSDTEIQITSDDTPYNVFIINHIIDAHKSLEFAKDHIWQEDFKIIVYGNTIHAYLCVNALLEIGITPENITFIESFPSENPRKTRVPIFCNTYVDQTIQEVLNNLKITVYRSYHFDNWFVNEDNIVTHVDFFSYAHFLRLECSQLFYYGTRGIDMRAYVAIHKSGLPYDGGIIIDNECRTRDPNVYAAGPNTRYHRGYYLDKYVHKYYDSYEVGQKLGTRIRNRLDPLFSESRRDTDKKTSSVSFEKDSQSSTRKDSSKEDYKKHILMEPKRPKVMYCVLPGGLRYLEVRAPGLKIPHHYVQSLVYNGYVMETFKRGYFKLHLTRDFKVDGVTCLSPAKFSLHKFTRLYGHSAKVLKNVHLRFSAKKLDDFYEFFRAPWAFFLYHDQADDLFAMSKELFPKNPPSTNTLKEALQKALKDHSEIHVPENFRSSAYVEAITDYVMDWVSQNYILLPMYLQPWHIAEFSHDLQGLPMFKKKEENI